MERLCDGYAYEKGYDRQCEMHCFLLEGMACKGGCVGGPGTTQPVAKATKLVNEFSNKAKKRHAFESEFINSIEELTHEHETQKN